MKAFNIDQGLEVVTLTFPVEVEKSLRLMRATYGQFHISRGLAIVLPSTQRQSLIQSTTILIESTHGYVVVYEMYQTRSWGDKIPSSKSAFNWLLI